jgi:hypothetical protein
VSNVLATRGWITFGPKSGQNCHAHKTGQKVDKMASVQKVAKMSSCPESGQKLDKTSSCPESGQQCPAVDNLSAVSLETLLGVRYSTNPTAMPTGYKVLRVYPMIQLHVESLPELQFCL